MSDENAKTSLPDSDERRQLARGRALVGATIVFRDGTSSVHCIVRNRSQYGAQLEIPENHLVPKRFYLVTAKDASVHDAELVWRTGNRMGIALLGTVDLSTANNPALRHLRRLLPRTGTDHQQAEHDRKLWEDESRWPV